MDSELLLVSLFTFSRGGVMSVSATSAFQKKKVLATSDCHSYSNNPFPFSFCFGWNPLSHGKIIYNRQS
jgi:hypothetical protein